MHRGPTLGRNISIRLWYVDFECNAGSVMLKKMLNASAKASVCFMFQFLSLYTNFHNLDACGKSTVCPLWGVMYQFFSVLTLLTSFTCAACTQFGDTRALHTEKANQYVRYLGFQSNVVNVFFLVGSAAVVIGWHGRCQLQQVVQDHLVQ